jgi:hypothetical protein
MVRKEREQERRGEQRQIGMVRKKREEEWCGERRSIGMLRKSKRAVVVWRTEKYRYCKKKKGSRKVGENGEVSEW